MWGLSVMDNLPFQLDLECLELRNSLIFDYLWIPEEVSLDLLSRSLTLSRGASGFRILDSAPCGAHLGRKQMRGLDSGFWILDGEPLITQLWILDSGFEILKARAGF